MLRQVSAGLRRGSNGAVVVACLVAFALFAGLVLPAESERARRYSGDAGSPDLSLFYAPADLYRMAEAYGEEGRREYVRARFTFDLAWPLVYGAALVSALSWLSGRAWPASHWGRLANLVPLAGVLSDYLENVTAALVVYRYPTPTTLAATAAPAFTLLKWSLLALSAVLILVAAAGALWRRLKEGRSGS